MFAVACLVLILMTIAIITIIRSCLMAEVTNLFMLVAWREREELRICMCMHASVCVQKRSVQKHGASSSVCIGVQALATATSPHVHTQMGCATHMMLEAHFVHTQRRQPPHCQHAQMGYATYLHASGPICAGALVLAIATSPTLMHKQWG